GTDIGVFTSNDNGQQWTPQTDGPATVPVEQLLWKNDNTLLAVTHGRGMYLGTEAVVFPIDYTLVSDMRTHGPLQSLFSSDDEYLRLETKPFQNPDSRKTVIDFHATSPTQTPSQLQVRIESNIQEGRLTQVQQRIEMRNYSTGKLESYAIRQPTSADESIVIEPTGDLSRFVEPGSQRVTARLSWAGEMISGLDPAWNVYIDEVVWSIE
ncbi:MAG: hypothetical protein ACR2NP_22090, partial [Pirellulaceae bacterium]